jgi:glycosyltransferase involved in cell wall biosynthesis
MNSLVSIVIPTYNYGRFLGEAIESALAQTYSPVEVFVMDDGSTDNTPEVATSFGNRIRYIRNPNRGVYATRQASLDHVRGAYFLNLDADNRLHPECVAKAVSLLQATNDPTCAFVYTQHQHFGDTGGFTRFPAYDLAELKRRNYIDMGALIKTDIVRRFGFDPAFNSGYGDYDFFLTLAEHGFHGVLLDEPLLYYRVHGSSITQSVNKSYRQVEIITRLIRKHHTLYSPAERRQALQTARDRVLLAIVTSRNPGRPFGERLSDLARILGTRTSPAQLWEQIKYTLAPCRSHSP